MCNAAHERAIRDLANGKRDGINLALLREAVIAEINRKLGSPKCDLWTFLREKCGYKDQEIRLHLCHDNPSKEADQEPGEPRKAMSMIQVYAEMITSELCRIKSRCHCAERYQSYEPSSRKYPAMQEGCERKHHIPEFLNQQKRAPLEWLANAVHGASNLFLNIGGMFRQYGGSMLCAVHTTPAESSLYLVPYENLPASLRDGLSSEAELLIDSRRLERHFDIHGDDTGRDWEPAETSLGDVLATWRCVACDRDVTLNNYCNSTLCHWELGSVTQGDETGEATELIASDPDQLKRKTLNVCANRHFWPSIKTKQCPAPGCGERAMNKITITLLPHPVAEEERIA